MSSWNKNLIGKIIKFNPSVKLQKGVMAKKVPMPYISEFQRKIKGFEFEQYKSGPKFQNGDVLLAKINPSLENGKAAKVDILEEGESAFGSSEFIVLRETNKSDSNYIYYLIISPTFRKKAISCMEGTSGRRRVNENALKYFELPFPKKDEQKRIGKILSDLDAKIEVNNKINSELEAMAKLIYDYWFVQFDFPNEDGKPYKSSGGKMVYNEELKREIPEGWDSNTMKDWIENDANGDWGQSEPSDNYTLMVNCIRGADLPSLDGFKTNSSPTRFINQNNTHKILNSNDLIVEISGGSPTQSTGRISYVTQETFKRYEAPLICSNFCKAVRLKNPKNLYNFYYSWKEAFEQGNMFNYEGKTSGIRNLLFSSLIESFKSPIPNPDLIDKFYVFMQPIQKQKQQNLLENQKLTGLRDWLLPMLMNGQVKVGEAEKELGMVAEPGEVYIKDKESIDSLFETINYDYEVAAIQLLTERRFGFTYGKKYTHKMLSNIEMLNTMPKLNDLVFEEKGWGMFSKAIAKTIDSQKFVCLQQVDYGKYVLKVKHSCFKEVLDWTAKEENKDFVEQVNAMLDIYEKPLINKDMDRIELLNTVLECIKVLKTDNLQSIRAKMAEWRMYENNNQTKAEKFTENETMHMIGFVKSELDKNHA